MHCDSLDLDIRLHRKEPIDKVSPIFFVHAALSQNVIEARIVLQFFISDLIVKLLNFFIWVELVWFRPKEKLW